MQRTKISDARRRVEQQRAARQERKRRTERIIEQRNAVRQEEKREALRILEQLNNIRRQERQMRIECTRQIKVLRRQEKEKATRLQNQQKANRQKELQSFLRLREERRIAMQLEKDRADLQLKKQRDAIRLREEKVILERGEQAKLNRQKAQKSSWQFATPLKSRMRDKKQETIRFQKNQEASLVLRQKEEKFALQEQKQSVQLPRVQRERSLLDRQHDELRQRERNDDLQLQEQEHISKLRDQEQKFLLQERQELLRQREKEQNEIQEENQHKALRRQETRHEEDVRRQDQETLHQPDQAADIPIASRLPYNTLPGGGKRVTLNYICIYDLSTDRHITSLPTNVELSACVDEIKDKIKHEGDLDLWIMNRNIFMDKGKSIADYKGVKKIYAVRCSNKRNPDSSNKPTEPTTCIIDRESVDDCISMSCGHAITPKNLLDYYWYEIKKGCTEVECPHDTCKAVLEFTEVRELACLSTDEILLFVRVLFMNWLTGSNDAFLCPRCGQVNITACPEKGYFRCLECMKKGKGYGHTFCTRCLKVIRRLPDGCTNSECQQSIKQTKSLLQKCDVMTIDDVGVCPTIRACPVCQHIIRYNDSDSRCKHMECANATCRTKFCFVCLSTPTKVGQWPDTCGGAFTKCEVAPRQEV
ncbi:uncharacterized protein [Argopecten irradians]|uniref:uncharacterized protein n=1 Tax=Argopecten irradians TaxID=31199 RepID=UPI0037173D4A